jgi:hypothetical protein
MLFVITFACVATERLLRHALLSKLAILATMHAAILSVGDAAPPLASAVWLGGAGLSVCGFFIVQYGPIRALGIDDKDMRRLVQGDRYVKNSLLAASAAIPVVMALWSSILFTIGLADYAVQVDLGGKGYKILVLMILGVGIVTALSVLIVGEYAFGHIESQVCSPIILAVTHIENGAQSKEPC